MTTRGASRGARVLLEAMELERKPAMHVNRQKIIAAFFGAVAWAIILYSLLA